MSSQSSLAKAASPSKIDRRMSTRHPCAGTAVKAVIVLGDEPCVTVVQDLSLGGVGVFLNAIVAPGEWIKVELRCSPTGAWIWRQLRAVHVSPARSGKWLLGGEFDQPLELSELRRLLVKLEPAHLARRA